VTCLGVSESCLGHVSALTGLTAWLEISPWTTVSRELSGAFGRTTRRAWPTTLPSFLRSKAQVLASIVFPSVVSVPASESPTGQQTLATAGAPARNWLPARPDKGRVWIPF